MEVNIDLLIQENEKKMQEIKAESSALLKIKKKLEKPKEA